MASRAPTPSPPPQAGTRFEIRPIHDLVDIPRLAEISELSLKSDSLFDYRARFGHASIYEDTVMKLTDALHQRQRISMFKAVMLPEDGEGEEVIVGYSEWMFGYVETPKTDPFAPRRVAHEGQRTATTTTFETDILNVTTSEAKEKQANTVADALRAIGNDAHRPNPFYSNPDAELSRKMGNAYISAIRGKKHLYLHRLIIHPWYQRQGLGQRLLDWGIEVADRENVVSWLFARPAGSKLYERNGWAVHSVHEADVPGERTTVATTVAMLRLPRLVKR